MDASRALCAAIACAGLVCFALAHGRSTGSGWWRQASAVRYGLARRLPRGGHDLTSASWSTFTDLIPFHALFETIQLPCLLLVTFSSHGSERSPGRPRFAAEGPKRSEGVSQPEPRRSSGLALPPCARWYSGSRAGWQGLASALGTQVLQTQALSQRLEERAGAGPLSPRRPPWLSHKTLCPRFATDRILRL